MNSRTGVFVCGFPNAALFSQPIGVWQQVAFLTKPAKVPRFEITHAQRAIKPFFKIMHTKIYSSDGVRIRTT